MTSSLTAASHHGAGPASRNGRRAGGGGPPRPKATAAPADAATARLVFSCGGLGRRALRRRPAPACVRAIPQVTGRCTSESARPSTVPVEGIRPKCEKTLRAVDAQAAPCAEPGRLTARDLGLRCGPARAAESQLTDGPVRPTERCGRSRHGSGRAGYRHRKAERRLPRGQPAQSSGPKRLARSRQRRGSDGKLICTRRDSAQRLVSGRARHASTSGAARPWSPQARGSGSSQPRRLTRQPVTARPGPSSRSAGPAQPARINTGPYFPVTPLPRLAEIFGGGGRGGFIRAPGWGGGPGGAALRVGGWVGGWIGGGGRGGGTRRRAGWEGDAGRVGGLLGSHGPGRGNVYKARMVCVLAE